VGVLIFGDSLKFLSLLIDKDFGFRHVDVDSNLPFVGNDTVNFGNF